MKDSPNRDPAREVFGSPEQQSVLRLGEQAMRLLRDNPRFCAHGRGVSVAEYAEDTADLIEALARLIGIAICESVKPEDKTTLVTELEQRGFMVDGWRRYAGFNCNAARAVLEEHPAPDGLTVEIIDAASPPSLLEAYAEVAGPQDVLRSNGGSLRGEIRPGFGMVAFASDGTPVGVAASVRSHHVRSVTPNAMQWGQIATATAYQGKGIARWLGALSIVHAFENFGASEVYTGIREGNAPSKGLCEGLGVHDTGFEIVAAINPDAFGGGHLTK